MDFKIGDEIEDKTSPDYKPNKNSKLPLIIVIVVSILIGLTVFFVSNIIFNPKKPQEPTLTEVDLKLNDENVKILYEYVTYGTNKRNDKFIKEENVTLDSFSNEEKFYYALQFANPEDFIFTSKLDSEKRKIYSISNNTVKGYMQRFFGKEVTYSTNEDIKYRFTFSINNKNVGEMKYREDSDGFDTVFTSLEEKEESELVEPFYTELISAKRGVKDNSITLVENVIYPVVEKNNDLYTINVYKDYNHTMLIDTRQNIKEEQIKESPINISDYRGKTSTITYVFKVNGNTYYFDNSKITN